jgi:hypothetical protein
LGRPGDSFPLVPITSTTVATDPNSALGAQVGPTLTYHPAALPAGVTSPGANAVIATAINAVVNASVTNFTNVAAQCAE